MTKDSSTLPPISETPQRRRPRRIGGCLLYGGAGLLFAVLSAPLWYWIPAAVWYSYVERVPFHLMKNGVKGELEIVQKRFATGAYRYFWKQARESKAKQGHFPCVGQGWICSSDKLACELGAPRYQPDPKRWQHACWKLLNVRLPGSFYLRYCYKSEGVGRHARYMLRASGSLHCGKTTSNLMLTRRAFSSEFSIISLPTTSR